MLRRQGGYAAGKLSKTEMTTLEKICNLVDRSITEQPGPADEIRNEICVMINQYPNQDMVAEIVRRVRKKFKQPHALVLRGALDVTDSLMLRCRDHVALHIGGEKFMKQIKRMCRVDRTTKGRSEYQGVANKARNLLQQWAAMASEIPGGVGSAFLRAQAEIQADAPPPAPQGLPGNSRYYEPDPYQGGIDERNAFDLAVTSSLAELGGGSARGSQGSVSLSLEGDLLDQVPPSVEALRDVLENSRNLADLKNNDIGRDVVESCRSLRQRVAKEAEKSHNSESKLHELLTAHDELNTVLSQYDGALTGAFPLPITRSRPETRGQAQSSDLLDFGSESPVQQQSGSNFVATDFASFGSFPSAHQQQQLQRGTDLRPQSVASVTSSLTALSFGPMGTEGAPGAYLRTSAAGTANSAARPSAEAFDPFADDSAVGGGSSLIVGSSSFSKGPVFQAQQIQPGRKDMQPAPTDAGNAAAGSANYFDGSMPLSGQPLLTARQQPPQGGISQQWSLGSGDHGVLPDSAPSQPTAAFNPFEDFGSSQAPGAGALQRAQPGAGQWQQLNARPPPPAIPATVSLPPPPMTMQPFNTQQALAQPVLISSQFAGQPSHGDLFGSGGSSVRPQQEMQYLAGSSTFSQAPQQQQVALHQGAISNPFMDPFAAAAAPAQQTPAPMTMPMESTNPQHRHVSSNPFDSFQ